MTVTTVLRTGITAIARYRSHIPGARTIVSAAASGAAILTLGGCAVGYPGYPPAGVIYSRLPPGSNGSVGPAPVFAPDAVAVPTPVPYARPESMPVPLQSPVQAAPEAPVMPAPVLRTPSSSLAPAPTAAAPARTLSAAEIAQQRMDRYNEIDRQALADQERAIQAEDALRQAQASAPVYYGTAWAPAYGWYDGWYDGWYQPYYGRRVPDASFDWSARLNYEWNSRWDRDWAYSNWGYGGPRRSGVYIDGGWGW